MKKLTVFTPTYNRAYLLPRLYKSLCSQTDLNFIWLIIDDGSSDNTKTIVDVWQKEDKISIQYFFKKNGGMHTAHNLAYKKITTEINVCIDSDDYLPENAVSLILNVWNSVSYDPKIAGIVGLDQSIQGSIIGSRFPPGVKRGNLYDLYQKKLISGDKKVVLRTRVTSEYEDYPEFEGEKLVPLDTLYQLIGLSYEYVFTNDVFCIVDYQPGGSSKTILKQYFQSPKGFIYSRKIRIRYSKSNIDILKNIMHLSMNYYILKDLKYLLKNNKYRILTIILIPLSLPLYFYIKCKAK